MGDQENYFVTELARRFAGQGRNLSSNICNILSKSQSSLSGEELNAYQNIVVPSFEMIRNELRQLYDSSSESREAWKGNVDLCSSSIIGVLASEVWGEHRATKQKAKFKLPSYKGGAPTPGLQYFSAMQVSYYPLSSYISENNRICISDSYGRVIFSTHLKGVVGVESSITKRKLSRMHEVYQKEFKKGARMISIIVDDEKHGRLDLVFSYNSNSYELDSQLMEDMERIRSIIEELK